MGRSLTRTRIGRFELIHRFAIGGMGEIFLARERGVAGFERQLVIKLLIPELAEQPDLVTLFIDEARIAANLAHPNIVQIFEFGRDDGVYFLAMEYVPGENLARICGRAAKAPHPPLTRELAVHVVAEMARGLDFAHHARDAEGKPLGIVHRDVSPHNLLLSIHGDVKVMDFGIAKAANTLHRTATGVLRGKLGYMSPEQLAGDSVDLTTDVYSAGIVLWELTLMRRLWSGYDELAVLVQARAGKIPRPSEIDPSYPRDLEEIAMRAVARDHTQRTPSASVLAAELRGWLAHHGVVIERGALGNVVKELFPEIDHETPVRRDEDHEPRTASLPEPTTTPTVVSPPPSPSPAEPALTGHANSRTRRIAIAAAVIAAGVGVLAVALGDRDPPPAITMAEPSSVVDRPVIVERPPAIDAMGPAGISVDAAVPAPVDQSREARPRATRRDTKPREIKPHETTTAAGSAAAVAPPAPPAAPEVGWLVVQSTPWGTFSLPNQAPLTTPRKLALPAGDYPITITFSEAGATIQGTATVRTGATTKCRGTAAGLSCGR